MSNYRVIRARKVDLNNPIILHKGEKVICGEESNEGDWAGWIFCKSDNNEGWVPKQIINRSGEIGFIVADYNAKELDVDIDELIIMDKVLNGWVWGNKIDEPSIKGWVPLNHLEEV